MSMLAMTVPEDSPPDSMSPTLPPQRTTKEHPAVSLPPNKYNTSSHARPTSPSTVSQNYPETNPDATPSCTRHKSSRPMNHTDPSSPASVPGSPVAGTRASDTMYLQGVVFVGIIVRSAGIRGGDPGSAKGRTGSSCTGCGVGGFDGRRGRGGRI